MSDSILNNIKKILGLDESYTVFDVDVLIHINSVFSTLGDLGIGPAEGFAIDDATATWDDFLAGDKRKNSVKTYIYLRVKMLFDPPATSYLITAMKEECQQLEWRLNAQREEEQWTDPNPLPLVEGL